MQSKSTATRVENVRVSASFRFQRCTGNIRSFAPLPPAINRVCCSSAGITLESDPIPTTAHSPADPHMPSAHTTAIAEALCWTAVVPTGRYSLHGSQRYSREKRTHSVKVAAAPPATRMRSPAGACIRQKLLLQSRLSGSTSGRGVAAVAVARRPASGQQTAARAAETQWRTTGCKASNSRSWSGSLAFGSPPPGSSRT